MIAGNHDPWSQIHKKWQKGREKARSLNPNITTICHDAMVNIGKFQVRLNHFPYLDEPDQHSHEDEYTARYKEWRPERGRGESFLLQGHRHCKPEDRLREGQLEVSWDAWGRPVSEEEIYEIIKVFVKLSLKYVLFTIL